MHGLLFVLLACTTDGVSVSSPSLQTTDTDTTTDTADTDTDTTETADSGTEDTSPPRMEFNQYTDVDADAYLVGPVFVSELTRVQCTLKSACQPVRFAATFVDIPECTDHGLDAFTAGGLDFADCNVTLEEAEKCFESFEHAFDQCDPGRIHVDACGEVLDCLQGNVMGLDEWSFPGHYVNTYCSRGCTGDLSDVCNVLPEPQRTAEQGCAFDAVAGVACLDQTLWACDTKDGGSDETFPVAPVECANVCGADAGVP